ncbi:oxidoreductase [Lignipirellula cremea]|uniref:Putative acrylyl-CoA reductase AcuI n=1 Tax=Lignipirellula cremea TaxID=2528010 RepID=A0A518E130_9BACT|nr:oxidoreductase [Lignipirellula cremea]QDU97807.1 putative acrylyl-CoA reductase AcuI [Lignipirellula cremea]
MNASSPATAFRCFLVRQGDKYPSGAVEQQTVNDLPPGEVLVRVAFSSLNYKDAMAATGDRGVARKLPLAPGIDLAGEVVASTSSHFEPGDSVFATGYELGVTHWGGWSEYARVPADWLMKLPAGMSAKETMTFGTAGLTAAQCVLALVEHGVKPEDGDIVVTGATGGVGSYAIGFLHRLGYRVTAVSGKPEASGWLTELGASSLLGRQEMERDPKPPLLSARWAGAVDTVGGQTLVNILRETSLNGCVAACGMAGGGKLEMTVFPFILRGVTLAGVGTAYCSRARREQVWGLLAGDWKPNDIENGVKTVTLDTVFAEVEKMLQGQHQGRTLIDLRS